MTIDQSAIQNILDSLEIPYRVLLHPAVFTVEESTQHLSDKIPVKNLVLYEEKGTRVFLVIMAGLKRLDTKRLASALTAKKLRFASADMLLAVLGVTPGSVSLFNLYHSGSNNIEVVFDQELLDADELGFHPGANTATVFIPSASVETILKHTGHRYVIAPL